METGLRPGKIVNIMLVLGLGLHGLFLSHPRQCYHVTRMNPFRGKARLSWAPSQISVPTANPHFSFPSTLILCCSNSTLEVAERKTLASDLSGLLKIRWMLVWLLQQKGSLMVRYERSRSLTRKLDIATLRQRCL